MRLTERDVKLIKDIALSHLLSRDQVIQLGYFSSVTRANTRLRELATINLVRQLSTPFFGQCLYSAGRNASEIVGARIGAIIEKRLASPRFVQHALNVTNVRIALQRRGACEWRFEQQVSHTFKHDRTYEVRPDGLVLTSTIPILVEADLGHVTPTKFVSKLRAYRAFVHSGACEKVYHAPTFRLLTVTTGADRSRHLASLLPPNPGFEYLVQTFEELGIQRVTGWS